MSLDLGVNWLIGDWLIRLSVVKLSVLSCEFVVSLRLRSGFLMSRLPRSFVARNDGFFSCELSGVSSQLSIFKA